MFPRCCVLNFSNIEIYFRFFESFEYLLNVCAGWLTVNGDLPEFFMAQFTGKTFLISGGARGLGEAQARLIVASGGQVVIGDILEAEGHRLAAELGAACLFQQLDVTQEKAWAEAVAAAEKLGPLHGLVNNAGVYTPLSMEATDTAEFERHTRINQLGTFLGMRASIAAFERTGSAGTC